MMMPIKKESKRTADGQAAYATIPRKAIREMAEMKVQNVGTREDREKKKWDEYKSRERD